MIKEKLSNEAVINELAEAGLHLGYSRSRNHPSVKSFIYGFKNRQAVIDLEQTAAQLARACDFITSLAAEGKEIVLVGNKNEAVNLITRAAEALGLPYVASRWLGGTFTNWPQISSRIARLHDLKEKKEKGELSIYTKKERALFDKEIARLERYLLSLSGMQKLPAAVVVIDPRQEAIVVAEAVKVKIPVVALAGSDCDLAGIAYPVVGNDASVQSIQFFLDKITAAYRAGQLAALKAASTPAVTETEKKS